MLKILKEKLYFIENNFKIFKNEKYYNNIENNKENFIEDILSLQKIIEDKNIIVEKAKVF